MRLFPRLVVFGLIASLGCGSGGGGVTAPISPINYNASTMADEAIKLYDKNGDGKIAGAELDACPALKSVLGELDKNKDKAIDRAEIFERINNYTTLGVGSTMIGARAHVNGGYYEGIEVTFVPEDFMQGTITGGSGTSDSSGIVSIQGSPGLACGFYKVKFSFKSNGTETLPAKYTSGSAVGVEVFAGRGGGSQFDFNLTK